MNPRDMGIGNLKVRRMFKKARAMSDKYGGAVIFVDELDALGGSRGAVSERFSPDEGTAPKPHRIFMVGWPAWAAWGSSTNCWWGWTGS